MQKHFTRLTSIALFGGAIALFGCNKATDVVRPVASSVSQSEEEDEPIMPVESYGELPTPKQLEAQNKWLWYAEKLENGEAADPSGQYVAKNVDLAEAEPEMPAQGDERSHRPKLDGSQTDWGFSAYTATHPVGTPQRPACEDCLIAPAAGGADCARCSATTFVTSQGLGGDDFIKDVKLVVGKGTPSSSRLYNAGYTKLDSDLNRGAGGAYIYFAFTRNENTVLRGAEVVGQQIYTEVERNLTSFNFQTINHWYDAVPRPIFYFYSLWVPNHNPYQYWTAPYDLNAGAGGKYIYSSQTRLPRWPTFPNIAFVPVKEIGVLSGCQSTIQPPSGWYKFSNDLNEGAGGDYIYLCTRSY